MSKVEENDVLTQLATPSVTVRTRTVTCDNCSWTGVLPENGQDLQLCQINDLDQRIEPGAEVPACECPECGSLAYLTGPESLSEVARTLCDTLASIRDHAEEFGSLEDFETRCAKMQEKAQSMLQQLANAGVIQAMMYVESRSME